MKTQITTISFALLALLLSFSARAACHFPPTRPQPSLDAYNSGKKIFDEQKKLSDCMKQSVGTIAYATQEGVFCSNVLDGTFSHHNLDSKIVKAYTDHKPFAIYYNGKSTQGKGGGIIFSKNEECAAGETSSLTIKADEATCGDFENSTAEYAGKTPGSALAQYIHVGAAEVEKCQHKAKAGKNDSSPTGNAKVTQQKKATMKMKSAEAANKDNYCPNCNINKGK